jgi:MFS family permease
VVSAVISLPACIAHLGYRQTQYIPEGPEQWIGPVYSLGQLFARLIAAYFTDKFGRKSTLLIGALMIDVGVSFMMWSPDLGVVILSRILEGMPYVSSLQRF